MNTRFSDVATHKIGSRTEMTGHRLGYELEGTDLSKMVMIESAMAMRPSASAKFSNPSPRM